MPPAIVRGKHTDLGFDGATCHLHDTTDRFTRRPGIGSLLGSRTVPVEALAGVRFEPARGLLPARIRLLLRPGADPLLEVNQRGFHDVEHPHVLPLESCQQEPARLMVARLEAAIASTGSRTCHPAGSWLPRRLHHRCRPRSTAVWSASTGP
jgi:hypothetical protein